MSIEAAKSATLKPWFLTFNQEDKEIFIWKNNVRLKLKDGSSAGPVTDVSILNQVGRTVIVSHYQFSVHTVTMHNLLCS